ncbi:hypothetical protein COV21_01355 [Candidatus Woesearchaeota archaeon CG10_big_fil_rev_8_21_14_0_10_45_5]|nr:MAG: hypothetical protein COV21_01355 [Candidatus Woesearchaeota archaeon CG10_big_fil_rev_8_21_14_0_10_45_5]PIU30545.1 MAG: hypothetical protein COT07_00145 [Candidatus Woesearchaeota archaeon CG07_land_8_20_14_0_80_44_23]
MAASVEERFSYLKEWLIPYLKSKDAFERQIADISDEPFGIHVKYLSKDGFFIIEPKLSELPEILSRIPAPPKSQFTAIFFNTKENFKAALACWSELVKIRNLKMLFVNPKSETDTKWIVAPYVHTLICDEHSVSRGLKSMFAMVEALTDAGIGKIIKKGLKKE